MSNFFFLTLFHPIFVTKIYINGSAASNKNDFHAKPPKFIYYLFDMDLV
jgi:hypothetical protein